MKYGFPSFILISSAFSSPRKPATANPSPISTALESGTIFDAYCVSAFGSQNIDTPKNERKFMIHAELLSESGERLHTISGHDSKAAPGVKLNSNCRDIRQ